MDKRFVTIWFRHLKTDWHSRRQPALLHSPFVLTWPDHNRIIISATNVESEKQGINIGTVLADARAIFPKIKAYDDKPELFMKLLKAFANYCIRYAPFVAVDPPDGLILDV